MADLGEMFREEAKYHASLIGATKVLHHDCIASDCNLRKHSLVPVFARALGSVRCSHGPILAGTKVRVLIRHSLQSWIFQWVSDGKGIPSFAINRGDCIQQSALEGEQKLLRIGLREGMTLHRMVSKMGEPDWTEVVPLQNPCYAIEVCELERMYASLGLS